jgi:hypothetical protein
MWLMSSLPVFVVDGDVVMIETRLSKESNSAATTDSPEKEDPNLNVNCSWQNAQQINVDTEIRTSFIYKKFYFKIFLKQHLRKLQKYHKFHLKKITCTYAKISVLCWYRKTKKLAGLILQQF